MRKIPTHLFKPKAGTLSYEIVSNQLAFDLSIPLEPFNSGIEGVTQPEVTDFQIDRNTVPVQSINDLDGQTFVLNKDPMFNDGSLNLGHAHNPADLKSIGFTRIDSEHFEISMTIYCDFEYEGIGASETIELRAKVKAIPKE